MGGYDGATYTVMVGWQGGGSGPSLAAVGPSAHVRVPGR